MYNEINMLDLEKISVKTYENESSHTHKECVLLPKCTLDLTTMNLTFQGSLLDLTAIGCHVLLAHSANY